jgi:hypothetical protein
MWRDLVAMAVLAALFVAALLSMPETPTERERFLRSRWERCEQYLAAVESEQAGYRIYHPAWVHILARRVGLRIQGRYAWEMHPEEWIVVGNEHAARAAVEVGR